MICKRARAFFFSFLPIRSALGWWRGGAKASTCIMHTIRGLCLLFVKLSCRRRGPRLVVMLVYYIVCACGCLCRLVACCALRLLVWLHGGRESAVMGAFGVFFSFVAATDLSRWRGEGRHTNQTLKATTPSIPLGRDKACLSSLVWFAVEGADLVLR